MPRTGLHFGSIVRQEPIDEQRQRLDPDDNTEEFVISDEDLREIVARVRRLQPTGRAIFADFGGIGFGDVAIVPGPTLRQPKGIRDVEQWYMSLVSRPHYIYEVFDHNPVQTSAIDMHPAALKQRIGDRITFWGGGIDTQRVLPFGTPAQIRSMVAERIRIFGAGGGFVYNQLHDVPAGVPIENLRALYQAVADFRGYPINPASR